MKKKEKVKKESRDSVHLIYIIDLKLHDFWKFNLWILKINSIF